MSEQIQPTVRPGAVQTAVKRLSIDDLAESALANAPAETPAPAARRGKPAEAPDALDVDEMADALLEDQGLGEDDEDLGEPGEETEGDEPEDAVDPRGTREMPYKRSDLPKDKFVELKVDGQKVVVPISEMADSYVAQKTFHQRVQQLHEKSEQIREIVDTARNETKHVKEKVNQLFKDPEALYTILVERYEPELDAIARRYATEERSWRTDPRARPAFEARLEQKRLEGERRAIEAEREATQRSREEQFFIDQQVKVFKPGWAEGLKQAGHPERTQELTDTVALFIRQKNEAGQMCDAKDIAAFVVRASKVLGLKPASRVPAKPVNVMGKPRRRADNDNAPRSGANSRHGKSVDFFLPERFRRA